MCDQRKKIAVLVAGMHRSGTSATSRVLSLVGCNLPVKLMEPLPDNNEKGFWESRPISDLNRDILASAGLDWDDWRPFDPGWYASPTVEGFRERARVLLRQEYGDSRLFVLKDPRICRLLPFWIEEIEAFGAEPRIVSPIRNPLDVAASLKQRDAIDVAVGLLLWLRHVLEAEAASRNLKRAYIRYEALVSEPHGTVDELGRALGISWPKRASVRAEMEIDAFLSRDLQHQRTGDRSVFADPTCSLWIRSSFALFDRWCRGEVRETDAALLDRITSAIDEAMPLFSSVLADGDQALPEREERIEGLEEALSERALISPPAYCGGGGGSRI